jgi:uncharacterized RDD family membrane protein YckC
MSSVARENDTPIHGLFSPEGVRLELPIAGPAPRMFAYGIDLCIIIALFIFMIVALMAILPIGDSVDKWMHAVFHEASRQVTERNKGHTTSFGALGGVMIALFVLAQFVVETGYFIFWEMVTNGRSPGKMLAADFDAAFLERRTARRSCRGHHRHSARSPAGGAGDRAVAKGELADAHTNADCAHRSARDPAPSRYLAKGS